MNETERSALSAEHITRLHIEPRPMPQFERPSLDTLAAHSVWAFDIPSHESLQEADVSPQIQRSEAAELEKTLQVEEPVLVSSVIVQPDVRPEITSETVSQTPPRKKEKKKRMFRSRAAREVEKRPAKKAKSSRKPILSATAAVLFISLLGATIYKQAFTSSSSAQVLAAQDTHSQAVDMTYVSKGPEDVPPAGYLTSYNVGPVLPRYISIPSQSLQARVIPVGVDGRGQPRLPLHSYDTGWYNVSATPGAAGAVVLSGTCTTPATKGVFERLHELLKGDEITIQRGDGVTIRYRVIESENLPTEHLDMIKVLRPVSDKAPGLNIVTCSGVYDEKTNDMSMRYVIYARQV